MEINTLVPSTSAASQMSLYAAGAPAMYRLTAPTLSVILEQ
jgi:hypothetical protein